MLLRRHGFAGQQLCGHQQLPARQALHTGRLTVQARTLEPAVGMWATKRGMDQFFHPDGTCDACTILEFEAGNIVTQVILICHRSVAALESQPSSDTVAQKHYWPGSSRGLTSRAAAGQDARAGRLHSSAGWLQGD